jgi:hypothetical protein
MVAINVWWLQAIMSGALALVFAFHGARVYRARRQRQGDSREALEHALVVSSTLAIISFANFVTSFATGIDDAGLRNNGGLLVRISLLVCAVYLLAAGPTIRQSPIAAGSIPPEREASRGEE